MAIYDRPALQDIRKPSVLNDARKDATGGFVISLERFCSCVVQSNRSGGTRLVNTVEMSGKIAHTAYVQRIVLQRKAPTLVISHQAESLPGCLLLRSARRVRIHDWTEAESSLLGPNDGIPLLSHCS